jgi:hypothetical protein
MTHQFSRSEFPPNGWIFHDPRTNFTAPSPKSTTFDGTVQLIIKNRMANGAMVVRHKLAIDPVSVGKELEIFTRRRLGMPDPAPPTPPAMLLPGLSNAVVGSVEGIKKLASGAIILLSFEQSGLAPVDPATATERANKCTICPKNNRAKYEEWRQLPVAISLTAKTPRLSAAKLTATKESELGLCGALFAPCAKLAQIPIDFIERRSKAEFKAQLDQNCWITNET